MRQIDAEHVQRWIAEHDAWVLPEHESTRLVDAIEVLPWTGAAPDWTALGAVRVGLDDPELDTTLAQSRLGGFEHLFVLLAPGEPGIVARLRDVIEGIDVLSWRSPGTRFFCGATRIGDTWRAEPDALGAYDGADHITIRA